MAKKPAMKKAKAKDAGLLLKARTELYAARGLIGRETQEELGLKIPFDVYYKDPFVAKKNPGVEIDTNFRVPWEPGIKGGPTSARFAVVDFDSATGKLAQPASWNRSERAFFDAKGRRVDGKTRNTAQFRQVSTWAMLQNTLDYFESGQGTRAPHSLGI